MIYLIAALWLSAGAFGVWLMVRDWLQTFGKLEVSRKLLTLWMLGMFSGPVAFAAGVLVYITHSKSTTVFTIGRKRPHER